MLLSWIFTLGLAAHRGAAVAIGHPSNPSTPELQRLFPETRGPLTHEELEAQSVIPNRWVVLLKEGAKKSVAEHAEWANSVHMQHPEGLAGVLPVMESEYHPLRVYYGEFSDQTVQKIRKDKDASPSHFITPGERRH